MICRRRSSDVFYAFDGPARSVLKMLVVSHPSEVWSEISNLLLSKDSITRHYLERLVRFENDDHLGAGLLYDLPSDLYLAWARIAPEERAAAVMKWLPIAQKASDGSLSWHPALVAFVDEFGQEKRVLSELSVRIHPSSWSGSVVPHVAPFVPLLEGWSSHPKSEVRRWARDGINSLQTYIRDQKKSEEEQNVGLF
jgi:hypothetical protein